MPRFAANLSLMYTEHPFLERFKAAADDGFQGVEFLFPYAFAPDDLARRLADSALQQVLINAPPGGSDAASMATAWEHGARGTACVPGCEAEFRSGITRALVYAQALSCPRIHVMAGRAVPGAEPQTLADTYVANLRWAAQQAARQGCEVLIEPINPRDMPGYYLNRQDHAHAVLAQVGEPNLKVQMDLYHCQIVEGDLSTKLRQYVPGGNVGHLQIASVPERHEPDRGELNYAHLFALLDTLGYTGWVGCEYRPRLGDVPGATRQGLGWRGALL